MRCASENRSIGLGSDARGEDQQCPPDDTVALTGDRFVRLSEHLSLFRDTCNVYAVRDGTDGVLIDFGSGDVLDHLAEVGIERVTDVLMTHHHRDQAQGLPRAVAAGIRIWVPPVEQDLFHSVDEHWQAREIRLDYNTRQDRFSLLGSVPITGVMPEYRRMAIGRRRFRILPTPGHTVGSVSIIARVDKRKVAFTGDLIYGPGKVWSMAATQWTYTGAEGAGASVLSLLDLRERRLDALLPSHGEPMDDPIGAIDALVDRFRELFRFRGRHGDLMKLRAEPYEAITPHLLSNRTSVANSYILRSDSGKALVIDFGYDFTTGLAAGSDRAARRPWLYTVGALARYGVTTLDVAVPTHYHDDHLAGFGLLREVLGTRIWVPENFVDLLEEPARFGVPCLWFDAIPADEVLPLERTVRWEEYELTFHELPGHTLWAVAISFTVDGVRVLATGDHQQDRWLNYTYANRFRMGDYVDSAALYRRLDPQLIISGHWSPVWVDAPYLDDLAERGSTLERIHQELLPLEDVDYEADGMGAWIEPYQATLIGTTDGRFRATARNPFGRDAVVSMEVVVPAGWTATPTRVELALRSHGSGSVGFRVSAPHGTHARRSRIAVDVTVDGRRFGQLAEALVDVRP
jgi:glyoxylase-like metal-dependent hydrolase (beta-lactamase superfamily II)